MRPVGLAGAVIAVGIVLGGAGAAGADSLVLQHGGLLSGTIEVSELVVATSGGEVRLGPREIQTVSLGRAVGDIVTLRNGRALTGRLEHPGYSIRLSSGQTIAFARGGVDQLHFGPRP